MPKSSPHVFSQMREWLVGALQEKVPAEQQLQRDAGAMMEELDRLADITAFAMARADEKYEALKNEVTRHETLGAQAEDFLRDGDDEAARRCVALQLAGDRNIQKLQEEYEALQQDAEAKAQQFLERKTSIEERVAAIPQLQDDARIVRMQEEMDKEYSALSLGGAQRSFDATARELEARKRQLANRDRILQDPNLALDRRIAQDTQNREIDRVLDSMRARLRQSPIIDVEVTEIEESEPAVNAAKQLLQAPRYKGVLPQGSGSTSSGVPSRSVPQTEPARRKAPHE